MSEDLHKLELRRCSHRGEENRKEVSPMPGDRVLLVDDEEDFLHTLSARMKARGLRVDTAESGEAALEKVKEKNFDAIVLDLAMPGLDGIETLKRLREINPDLQIILLTGHATVQKGVEAIKQGAIDLLEKPTDIEQLVKRIEDARAKKAVLVEKRIAEQMEDILRKKGW